MSQVDEISAVIDRRYSKNVACCDFNVQRPGAQKTKDEWNGVVREMISYGADIKEAQIPVVVEYLAKNYGPKK